MATLDNITDYLADNQLMLFTKTGQLDGISGGSLKTVSITFDEEFAEPPICCVCNGSIQYTNKRMFGVSSVTTTGCTVAVTNENTSGTLSAIYRVIAIGRKKIS